MKKYINLTIIFSVAFVLLGAGCFGGSKQTDQQQRFSLKESQKIAKIWIKNESPTYTYDGSKLKLKKSMKTSPRDGGDCKSCYEFVFEFESSQAGYGNRKDEMSAQVITDHEMQVIVEQGEVVQAITDDKYDEMRAKMLGSSSNETGSASSSKETNKNKNNTTSQKSQANKNDNNTTSQKKQNNTTSQKIKTNKNSNAKGIELINLESNDLVPQVFAIRGTAPSGWFFEGDFPIEVHPPGTTRSPYTTAIAKTDENYMTQDRVSFFAVVDMRGHNAQDIIVQFKKDNPYKKKKLADSERIGLRIEQAKTKTNGTIAKGIQKDGCVISGCSNETCAYKGKVGGCSPDPKYQCRRSGICSKDQNGNCRWLQDKAMKSCLKKVKQQP